MMHLTEDSRSAALPMQIQKLEQKKKESIRDSKVISQGFDVNGLSQSPTFKGKQSLINIADMKQQINESASRRNSLIVTNTQSNNRRGGMTK